VRGLPLCQAGLIGLVITAVVTAIVTAVRASIVATRIIPPIAVAVTPQVFQLPALTFDLNALLLNLGGLDVLSLPLALHLIANRRTAQGAECAADQRAFTGTVIAHCAANDRAGAGAECAAAQSSFFPFAKRCGTPSEQDSEA
jgi:hypothetical protein